MASDSFGNYTATMRLPLETPGGQNEITVFGHGPNGTCHQSLALFSVRERPIVIVERPHGSTTTVTGTSTRDDSDRHDDEDDRGSSR